MKLKRFLMFVSFLVILVCISLFHVESIQAEDTDPDYPQHTVPIQVEWHGEGGDTSQRPSIIYVDFESENEDKRSPLQGSNWTETAYIKKFNDDGSQINYTIQVSADPVTPYWYTVEGSVETGLTVHATKVDIINVPITLVWDDDGDESKRPNNIEVYLYSNSQKVGNVIISKGSSNTSMQALKTDAEGHDLTYTNIRVAYGTAGWEDYTYTITGDVVTGYTITAHSRAKDLITVPFNVEWHGDDEDIDGRPDEIRVIFTGKSKHFVGLHPGNSWSKSLHLYLHDSDGSEITYADFKMEVTNDHAPYTYTLKSNGDLAAGYTVVATRLDSCAIDFSVTWKNDAKYSDSRPKHLIGEFKSNGRKHYLFPNDDLFPDNDWKSRAYFPKKDEDNQDLLYHSFTIVGGNDTWNNYTYQVTGDVETGFIITAELKSNPPIGTTGATTVDAPAPSDSSNLTDPTSKQTAKIDLPATVNSENKPSPSSQTPNGKHPSRLPATGEMIGVGMLSLPALLIAVTGLKSKLRRKD